MTIELLETVSIPFAFTDEHNYKYYYIRAMIAQELRGQAIALNDHHHFVTKRRKKKTIFFADTFSDQLWSKSDRG